MLILSPGGVDILQGKTASPFSSVQTTVGKTEKENIIIISNNLYIF